MTVKNQIQKLILETLGHASVAAWSERPRGVFQSEEMEKIGLDLLDKILKITPSYSDHSDEIGQELERLFPGSVEDCEDDHDVVVIALQKLRDYATMSEQVFEGIKFSELCHRNTFLIGQWNHLEQVAQANSMILMKKPGDITALGKLARVQHDLDLIRAAANQVNQQIMDLIESESGKEFKYLPTSKNVSNAK